VDEKIDIVDEAGRPTGEIAWKSEAHRSGLLHRCFHCWVAGRDDAGGPYLLVQRRAATKETWPGRLDVTAAGHLEAGEEPLEGGLRELEEELGLRVEPERLVPLGTRRVDLEIPQGLDRELHDVFLLLDDTPPGELRLQREEVEAVLSIRLEDAQALDAGGVPAMEYMGRISAPVLARPSDFVPSGDDYLRRVAGAARLAVAGERPGKVF
jgi:8-oxo-dGTP pyrophosphatase MutT (NUDIX family)